MIDGPTSLRYGVLHLAEEKTVKGWSALDKAVENGAWPFKEAFGSMSVFTAHVPLNEV